MLMMIVFRDDDDDDEGDDDDDGDDNGVDSVVSPLSVIIPGVWLVCLFCTISSISDFSLSVIGP